jgi:hypothetical protein
MYPSKESPDKPLDIIPLSTRYLVTTNTIFYGFSSYIGRLKSYLSTPHYFNPYFDPYSDASSNETPVTAVPRKWECTLFKTDFVHVAATMCHYFFSNSPLVDDVQTIINMNWILIKKGRKTTHVSDLICFTMDIQRHDKEFKSAIKHAQAEATKRKPQRYPSILYDGCFLDERWNLVDKLDQKDDSDWDIVGTYQVKPVVSSRHVNGLAMLVFDSLCC